MEAEAPSCFQIPTPEPVYRDEDWTPFPGGHKLDGLYSSYPQFLYISCTCRTHPPESRFPSHYKNSDDRCGPVCCRRNICLERSATDASRNCSKDSGCLDHRGLKFRERCRIRDSTPVASFQTRQGSLQAVRHTSSVTV